MDKEVQEAHGKEDDNDYQPMDMARDDIHRIPPEIWDAIFEKLRHSTDLVNVYEAVPYWESVLLPNKCSWLFPLVFPRLLDLIPREDILKCRLVSKRWCYAVDHYLENNAFHRPATEDAEEPLQNHQQAKIDRRLRPLLMTLHKKKLIFKALSTSVKTTLLKEAAVHPRCPLVGRSVFIYESSMSNYHYPPTNLQFLQKFGHHVWFLKMQLRMRFPIEVLARFLDLIVYCPNLKKLEIFGEEHPPPGYPNDNYVREMNLQLSIAIQRWHFNQQRQHLPKLETLDVEITGPCHFKLKEIILTLFFNDNLCSLAMDNMPSTRNMQAANLTDLSISLNSDTQLDQLRRLHAPLQRLLLHLCGLASSSFLFDAVYGFRTTLKNFGLHIAPEYYTSCAFPATDLPALLPSFKKSDILGGCYIKSTSLKGCRPMSFNYLCGLDKSLEYLHIYMENFEDWEKFLNTPLSVAIEQGDPEVLDLLDILPLLSESSKNVKCTTRLFGSTSLD